MDKETKQEFDNLGRMIKVGFDDTNKRIDDFKVEVNERFERVDEHFSNVNARLDTIEKDISYIKNNFVYRQEFEDLLARVKYLETKLGIESGK